MMILVTGGSKCGKSSYAESIFESFSGPKFYIATMQPFGTDAEEAIARHRKMRLGKGFETIERYTDIGGVELPENSGILLECVGNLCANEMFSGADIIGAAERVINGIRKLSDHTALLVAVTNQVGSDGITYDEGTARYIAEMGRINTELAELSDQVTECVYGIRVVLKGGGSC